jgi:uncharacterized membrane protein
MDWLGLSHVAVAVVALASGGVIAISRKATRQNRRWGWEYATSMLAVNTSALSIYQLTGHFGPFHMAAIFSLLTIIAGVVPVRLRPSGWVGRHAYWMSGSYVGLLAALAAETTTRVDALPFWATAWWTSLAVLAVGATVIARRVPAVVTRFNYNKK